MKFVIWYTNCGYKPERRCVVHNIRQAIMAYIAIKKAGNTDIGLYDEKGREWLK